MKSLYFFQKPLTDIPETKQKSFAKVTQKSIFLQLTLKRRTVFCEPFHRQIFSLVIGKSEVILTIDQIVLGLLEGRDTLVDFLDGIRKTLRGKAVVASELFLEILKLLTKSLKIDVLGSYRCKLLAVGN